MKKINLSLLALLFTGLSTGFSTSCYADMYETAENTTYEETSDLPTYGQVTSSKLLSSLANITTGWIEIPKNMINTTNESNIFFGLFGGSIKGAVNTAGRLAVGITDLLTFPLPTKHIVSPVYVWNDFDVDTSYGDVFSMQETQ